MVESARKPSPRCRRVTLSSCPPPPRCSPRAALRRRSTPACDDHRSAAGLRTRATRAATPAAKLPPNTTRTTAPARARRRTSTQIPDAVAAARAAASLRQPPVHRARPRLRAGDHAAPVPRARRRVVVRPQVPRPEDVDRRDLRHVRDDRRAPDAAAAVVRARHQRRDRQERGRARQRPRPVPARPHHRPLVRGGAPRRHRAAAAAARSTSSRSSRRRLPAVDRGGAAAARRARREPPTAACRPIPHRRRPRHAASSVQLGAFQNFANAQTFLAHVQGQLAAAQVEAEGARRPTGCIASTSARTRIATRRAAWPSASPPHSASRPRSRRIERSAEPRRRRRRRLIADAVNGATSRRPFVTIRCGVIASVLRTTINDPPHARCSSPPRLLAAPRVASRCPSPRARPTHHRDRRRRRHGDPDRDRPVRGRVRRSRSASRGIVGADLARSGMFRLVDTDGVTPRPVARRGRPAPPCGARAAPTRSSSARCSRCRDGRVEVRFALVDVVKQTLLDGDDVHGHAGAVPRDRAQDRRRDLREAHRRPGRLLDPHRVHHQGRARASSSWSPMPTAPTRRPIVTSQRAAAVAALVAGRHAHRLRVVRAEEAGRLRAERWRPAQRQAVANFRGSNSAPAWSPDGRRLAVTLTKDGGSQLYVMNADGGNAQRVHDLARRSTPRRTSRRTAARCCSRPTAAAARRSTALNLGSGAVERLTFDGSYNVSPRPLPDGKGFVFVRREGGRFQIAIHGFRDRARCRC